MVGVEVEVGVSVEDGKLSFSTRFILLRVVVGWVGGWVRGEMKIKANLSQS